VIVMRRRALSVVFTAGVLVLLTAGSLHAQLAEPGASGVTMGHVHFTVRDLEATRKMWLALGGTAVQNGQLQLIQFPGVFVMLRQG
jgi:hypothetical protein